MKVGMELGASADGRWLIVTDVRPGSMAHSFVELKPGTKILDICVNGEVHSRPQLAQALQLITESQGQVQLTVAPLIDRYGFICDVEEFNARCCTKQQVRLENEQLRKWEKRVISARAWQRYSAKKPEKLKTRIREGVPDAVRGFVWKAIAAARAPRKFRQDGMYHGLSLMDEQGGAVTQIDKDVPRTMTGHIFFRANHMCGQDALRRVLRAYAAFNKRIGYTQGMSSYAAVLILYMSEEEAFWAFAAIMDFCNLAPLFEDGFPLLHHYYDSWEALLRKHCPKLSAHITSQLGEFLGVGDLDYDQMLKEDDKMRFMIPSMYTTPWFQAMLVGGDNPAPSVLAPRLMDSILLDGNISIIFSLGLALMKQEQKALLSKTSDELATALKALPRKCCDIEGLLETAFEIHIKDKHLFDPQSDPSRVSEVEVEKL